MELDQYLLAHKEFFKDLFTAVTIIIALATAIVGVVQYARSIKIHRYEKYHEMSVRFDETDAIQGVCELLNDPKKTADTLKPQQKEVFICFIEEVYFMVQARVMKKDLAYYTFGYYATLADDSTKFWGDKPDEFNKDNPYYVHFRTFCEEAKANRPNANTTIKF